MRTASRPRAVVLMYRSATDGVTTATSATYTGMPLCTATTTRLDVVDGLQAPRRPATGTPVVLIQQPRGGDEIRGADGFRDLTGIDAMGGELRRIDGQPGIPGYRPLQLQRGGDVLHAKKRGTDLVHRNIAERHLVDRVGRETVPVHRKDRHRHLLGPDGSRGGEVIASVADASLQKAGVSAAHSFPSPVQPISPVEPLPVIDRTTRTPGMDEQPPQAASSLPPSSAPMVPPVSARMTMRGNVTSGKREDREVEHHDDPAQESNRSSVKRNARAWRTTKLEELHCPPCETGFQFRSNPRAHNSRERRSSFPPGAPHRKISAVESVRMPGVTAMVQARESDAMILTDVVLLSSLRSRAARGPQRRSGAVP